jgi:peptide/nickel transport system permease protein
MMRLAGARHNRGNRNRDMHPLLGIVMRRLGLGLLSLLAVSAIIFFSVELLPGDFARNLLGQSATPEAVAALREELGLNRPAIVRYGEWLAGVLQGDLGTSYAGRGDGGGGRQVSALVLPRLRNTFILAGLAALFAVPLALWLGMIAARRAGSPLDRLLNSGAVIIAASPEFLTGYLLMYWLAVKSGVLPPLATIDTRLSLLSQAHKLVLPVLTLGLAVMAHVMRMTRATLLEIGQRPWMEMALLKGLPSRWRMRHHALPNAAGPLASVVAVNMAWLITGVVVTETVFVYPGAGRLMVDAVVSRDIPVVQACALIFAAVYILLNLAADIVALLANPRLLHGGQAA